MVRVFARHAPRMLIYAGVEQGEHTECSRTNAMLLFAPAFWGLDMETALRKVPHLVVLSFSCAEVAQKCHNEVTSESCLNFEGMKYAARRSNSAPATTRGRAVWAQLALVDLTIVQLICNWYR